MKKFKGFDDKLQAIKAKYPDFSREYLEKRAEQTGSYSFFKKEFPMDMFNHCAFLKELHVKPIIAVTCEFCNKTFYKASSKNLTTVLYKHKIKCKTLYDFVHKYGWERESLQKELNHLGTVSDFIKKYPEIRGLAYELFHLYDIETSMKVIAKVVNKRKREISKEKTGFDHNFCKNSPSRLQWEKRLLDEEGITNVFQRESVKTQIKQTLVERYGESVPYRVEEIIEKGRLTSLKNWGFTHWTKNPDLLRKHFDNFSDKYGYIPTVSNFYARANHGILFSKPHKKVVNILKSSGIDCSVEFVIKIEKNDFKEGMNKYRYEYDIIIEDTNKLIEVNGDYYHANPNIYKETDILNFFGKNISVKDIWEKDKLKIDFAKKKMYTVLVVWEYDILNNLEEIEREVLNYARS